MAFGAGFIIRFRCKAAAEKPAAATSNLALFYIATMDITQKRTGRRSASGIGWHRQTEKLKGPKARFFLTRLKELI